MTGQYSLPQQLVFGLDIGTRNIVGTVGFLDGDTFNAVAQCSKAHETRAMIDGQIHDIIKVGATIKQVKEELEQMIDRPLDRSMHSCCRSCAQNNNYNCRN